MEIPHVHETFSVTKRAKSFSHAFRGIVIFLTNTHNAWVELVLLVVAICLGFYFDITRAEWLVVVLAGGLVLVSEAFNTAIEIDLDLTSPDFHPFAKDAKDVAAGAVLISSITALILGITIFWPYIA